MKLLSELKLGISFETKIFLKNWKIHFNLVKFQYLYFVHFKSLRQFDLSDQIQSVQIHSDQNQSAQKQSDWIQSG